MLRSAAIFTMGCAILLAAFGIGWADFYFLENCSIKLDLKIFQCV